MSVSHVLYWRQICRFFAVVADFVASWGGIYSGWGLIGNDIVESLRNARGLLQFMNLGKLKKLEDQLREALRWLMRFRHVPACPVTSRPSPTPRQVQNGQLRDSLGVPVEMLRVSVTAFVWSVKETPCARLQPDGKLSLC